MSKVGLYVATVVVALSQLSATFAAQQSVQTPLGEKVVHTRLAPVIIHRAVPPYAGRHIYQGRGDSLRVARRQRSRSNVGDDFLGREQQGDGKLP